MSEKTCKNCGVGFTPVRKRGRPPVYCQECRNIDRKGVSKTPANDRLFPSEKKGSELRISDLERGTKVDTSVSNEVVTSDEVSVPEESPEEKQRKNLEYARAERSRKVRDRVRMGTLKKEISEKVSTLLDQKSVQYDTVVVFPEGEDTALIEVWNGKKARMYRWTLD